jgi:O-antigen/teichoic acid export membrane protein
VPENKHLTHSSTEGSILASETLPYSSPATRKRTFVEHYGSTLLGQGFTLGLGILTGVLSARMLGPVGRGEYAAIIIWPMGIASFLAFGINHAVVFHLGQRNSTISEMATAATAIGLIQSILSIIIGLVVVPFALAKYSPEVQHLGIVFVLLTPALIFSVYPANLFQGLQDLLRFNLIRVTAPFVYAFALLGLYFLHRASLRSVIVSQLAGYVLALLLGLMLIWKILGLRVQWNRLLIPRLFHFGLRIQGESIATYFNQRIDQLALSLLVPPQQLGLYAVAVTISTAVTVFPQAAGIVAFSRGSSQKGEDARATIGGSFRASLIWLLICCGVLYVFSPFLIRLVFGAAFSGSILACRILLPGALMIGLNHVLYNGASALGRPELSSYAEGASVVVTAVGLYLLVPHYGYVGAAIVSTVAYSISFIVMMVMMHRLLGLSLLAILAGGRQTVKSGIVSE